jgi:hypothetical protein
MGESLSVVEYPLTIARAGRLLAIIVSISDTQPFSVPKHVLVINGEVPVGGIVFQLPLPGQRQPPTRFHLPCQDLRNRMPGHTRRFSAAVVWRNGIARSGIVVLVSSLTISSTLVAERDSVLIER